MTSMPSEQLRALEQELAGVFPAAGELVLDAVRAERAARTAAGTAGAGLAGSRALAAVPQLARRLVDVETEYAQMRTVLVRVLHQYTAGDDYTLSDLLWELSQVGLSLQPELGEAEALAAAAAAETLR